MVDRIQRPVFFGLQLIYIKLRVKIRSEASGEHGDDDRLGKTW